MNPKKKLISKVNNIVDLINKGKINNPAINELIEAISENEKFNELMIEELERDNIELNIKLSEKDNTELYIRIQSLGFSLFQFLTFDIKEAYKAQNEGKLKKFMTNHKNSIKCLMK
jgi:hypothetical protein